MNDREVFDMLLEKHPAWMENIKIKSRTEQKIRMLEPYDVESIEELIQNVRAKTIEEFAQNLKLKTHMENRLIDILAEQMKGDKE